MTRALLLTSIPTHLYKFEKEVLVADMKDARLKSAANNLAQLIFLEQITRKQGELLRLQHVSRIPPFSRTRAKLYRFLQCCKFASQEVIENDERLVHVKDIDMGRCPPHIGQRRSGRTGGGWKLNIIHAIVSRRGSAPGVGCQCSAEMCPG